MALLKRLKSGVVGFLGCGFHEWKFMALLKPGECYDDIDLHGDCFHEWKFMALLKRIEERFLLAIILSFHEWKFMALLKPKHYTSTSLTADLSFHEWKFMALLKRRCHGTAVCGHTDVSMNENSWLYWSSTKWTGTSIHLCVSMNENSWLYWSGLIILGMLIFFISFPWMKIHGSIEATHMAVSRPRRADVSMNENSWLYWSLWLLLRQRSIKLGFHEWKFMALLKREGSAMMISEEAAVSMNENSWLYWSWISNGIAISTERVSMNENSWLYWSQYFSFQIPLAPGSFHEWKFMALLKPRILRHWPMPMQTGFHEWKFMALLKLHLVGVLCAIHE